ncbi:SLC13 family permease [Saccharopolyspora halophila]|uniref:SLC13 family permease n=1 Tax=Saccharopolyspora halophila TaxID=405551 RepID=A0ABN3GHM6_9PSEU
MDALLLTHLGITVIGIVLMIVALRINPVISLVVGALYLGVAGGMGFADSVSAVTDGFGSLMAEVGLIIGFGVMIGTTLSATGTLQRVVDRFLALAGPKRSPYVLGLTSGIVFPAIYFDVALVILAPIAGAIAKRTGRSLATLAGALAIGLEVGLLIVVPGVAAVTIAGPLGVPLGTVLLWGVPLGIVFILGSIFLHDRLMRLIFNPDTDREPDFDDSLFAVAEADTTTTRSDGPGTARSPAVKTRQQPLLVAMLPVLVPIVLIVINTIGEVTGNSIAVLAFLGSPVVALIIGLLIGIVLAVPVVGRDGIDDLITKGAQTSGSILLFTGVAGSLGEVINKVGISDMLGSAFSANASIPVLLAWIVAAVLRLAQGSASVAAITAATLLAPIVGTISTPAILILLAAGTGAAFGGHVTDNTFWIFKQMLGFTVKGTFKIYTLAQSTFAVVGLGVCLLLGLVL